MAAADATVDKGAAGDQRGAHEGPAPRVQRFHPHDLRLQAPDLQGPGGNPFLVDVRAMLEGPDGRTTAVPGFYDGDGTWVVRVCLDAEGEWRYITQSGEPALDRHAGRLWCVPNENPRVHGALRVDPVYPHHFLYEDGERPFVLGYEANWLWALGFLPEGEKQLHRFCGLIAEHGFNHVFVNSYAHDTRWCPGTTRPEDYGPPPVFAWEGTNDAPDHLRPNPAYWRVFDMMMRALFDHGLTAHLYLKVYNKMVTWPQRRSLADDLFFKYVVARYQGFSNVVWDFSKESYNEPDKGYLVNRLALVRGHDGYGRLVTSHDDDRIDTDPKFTGVTDFVTDQHHREIGATTLRRRALRPVPYVNEEFAYECGPGGLEDKTYTRSNTAEEHALRSWEVVACGGYPGYYYTYTAWDVLRPEDRPPGYALHKRLVEFMRRTDWWRLEPRPEVASRGDAWCLARPGEEYVVFCGSAPAAGRGLTLTLVGAREEVRTYRCEWLQPLTGAEAQTEHSRGALGARTVLQAPWDDGPFVVRLRPVEPASSG